MTDWKYEKKRNDGTNYYGSHGRRLKNSGSVPIEVRVNTFDGIAPTLLQQLTRSATRNFMRLAPGATVEIKADIQEVSVPAKA